MYDMGGTPGAGGVINNSNRSIVAVDMDNHRHKVVPPGESLARGSSEDWDMVWDGCQCYKVYHLAVVTDFGVSSYARFGIRVPFNQSQKYNPFAPLPLNYCRILDKDFPSAAELEWK
jgi:hypothetical protein